jgi:ubiquinone biosynthesis protein
MSTMRAVYTNLRAARTAIKDFARLEQIVAVLARHGFGHVVEAWDLQDKAILKLLVRARPEEQSKKSPHERIAEALQELGPTFVKLGQILSTRPDLVPQALCDQLSKLQDRVTPITFDEARAVVETSLGRPLTEVFETFDERPLASASIAQVHTARLRTGEDVVVKVQRPGIRDTIESDLHILYFVARQLEETIPELKAFDPVAIAAEFDKAIRKELDFNHEANHLERFDRNFSSWPSIHVPRLYRMWSSDRVLVMERLVGPKVTLAGEHGHDLDAIAREMVRALFKMVFEDGFFHGDLHPGNILVLEDGRIGLIDFGLVGRMTPTMKDATAELLLAVVTHDYEGVARCFYELSIRTGRVDYGAWEADTIELMERYFLNKRLAEVDFGRFLRDLVEGAIRHEVRIPPDYTMFFKAIMTVEGIGKTLTPDLDLVSECRPYVEQLVAQRYSPERVMRAAGDALQGLGRLSRVFPVKASEFLGQMEDGKVAVRTEDRDFERAEEGRDRRLNRAALAAIACTLAVVGTMTRYDARFTLFGVHGVTLLTWTVAGWITLRLLFRIWRSGRW